MGFSEMKFDFLTNTRQAIPGALYVYVYGASHDGEAPQQQIWEVDAIILCHVYWRKGRIAQMTKM